MLTEAQIQGGVGPETAKCRTQNPADESIVIDRCVNPKPQLGRRGNLLLMPMSMTYVGQGRVSSVKTILPASNNICVIARAVSFNRCLYFHLPFPLQAWVGSSDNGNDWQHYITSSNRVATISQTRYPADPSPRSRLNLHVLLTVDSTMMIW
jgi:hypothetical protein